jgi:hypothetical protein
MTDQHCDALVMDHENARSVETNGHAHFDRRSPHSHRNRHTLIKRSGFGSNEHHGVVDGFWARFDGRLGEFAGGDRTVRRADMGEPRGSEIRVQLKALGATGLWRETLRVCHAGHGFVQTSHEGLAETMVRAWTSVQTNCEVASS